IRRRTHRTLRRGPGGAGVSRGAPRARRTAPSAGSERPLALHRGWAAGGPLATDKRCTLGLLCKIELSQDTHAHVDFSLKGQALFCRRCCAIRGAHEPFAPPPARFWPRFVAE